MTGVHNSTTQSVQGSGAADSERDRASFLSALNHEIRTPLNGIVGLTRLLLDTSLDDMQRESLEVILQSGESLAGALDDLLDLARLDTGVLAVESSSFDVRHTLSGVVDLVLRGEGRGACEITLVVEPHVVDELAGDVVRLRRLLMGILAAAAKPDPSAALALSVSQEPGVLPGRVVLRLSLTGPIVGLDAVTVAFGDGDRRTERFANLGLAVGRGMLHQLGGNLVRLPDAVVIELPLGTAKARQQPPEPLEQCLRLLVAEDNLVNQRVAKGMLERLGHEVVMVGDGFEAVAAVQCQRFDMVLMDVQMPGMDGIAATQAIRALRGAASRVPIVALTANAFAADRDRCLAAGMNEVLGKPIHPDDLIRLMAGVFGASDPGQGETLDSLRDIFGAEELGRLLAVLVESLQTGWNDVTAALAAKRLDMAGAAAHRIAGAAANFGFTTLRTAAKRLEETVDRGASLPKIEHLAAALKAEIDVATDAVAQLRR